MSWWFSGEPEERDEGERESSETGRRLYCCIAERGRMMMWRGRWGDGEEVVI